METKEKLKNILGELEEIETRLVKSLREFYPDNGDIENDVMNPFEKISSFIECLEIMN